MTTYRQFVDRLEALVITGVIKRLKTGRPDSLNTDDLPAQWVQFPRSADGRPTTFSGNGGWPTMRAELVIAVEAVGQNTGQVNFDAAVDMMDNVTAVLVANDCGITTAKITWTIILTVRAVAGVDYWVVATTIEGYG